MANPLPSISENRHVDRLLERATFGPRPGEREAARALGPDAWLETQLAGRPEDEALASLRSRLPQVDPRPEALLSGLSLPMGRGRLDEEARRQLRRRARETGRQASGARLVRAVHGPGGLHEVMADFWLNHFSVGMQKGAVGVLLPAYQQVVDRDALGRLPDLLLEVARSPAMLVYLDNWSSVADGVRRRRGARRARGLNENYARELLELHTLGVEAGYTQRDVVEVARVFTGWTLESARRPVYRYVERLHDAGAKSVMGEGTTGSGEAEGRRLLERLALHPATAQRIARKLVERFVADDPPPALVERAARRYVETRGDVRAVLRVVLLAPELATSERRKLKTPFRWLASALRATGGETDGRAILRDLVRLGEVPFGARSPAGHPEPAVDWIDPGAMLGRMQLAFALADGRVRGTRLGPHTPAIPGEPAARRAVETLPSQERGAVVVAGRHFQWS